jgi:hypothetical protein
MSSPIEINDIQTFDAQTFFGTFGDKVFFIRKVRFMNEEGKQITIDVDQGKNNCIFCGNKDTHVTVWTKNKEYSFKKGTANMLPMKMLK